MILSLAFLLIIGQVAPILHASAQEAGNVPIAVPSAPGQESGPLTTVQETPVAVEPDEPAQPGPESTTEQNPISNLKEPGASEADKSTEPAAQSAAASTGTQGSGLKFQTPANNRPSVDESTGSLQYKYQVPLPAGRNGMVPDLALAYSSQNMTRLDSIIGLGWGLTIPSIQREPIKGTDKLYSQAYFSTSLSGSLVPSTVTSLSQFTDYYAESDSGDFTKHTYLSDNSWSVLEKDGTVHKFGLAAASRQDNPANPSQVYKWMVTKSTDVDGNEVQYSYTKDGGQIYPSQIVYSYHPSAPAVYTVDFTYSTPSGYGSTGYNSAFPVTTAKLLQSIKVTSVATAGNIEYTYNLVHSDAQFIKQKLLTDIRSNRFTAAIDTVTFSYSTKQAGWQQGTHSLENGLPYIDDTVYNNIKTADFDNNGFTDVLVTTIQNSSNVNKLNLNTGTAFVESASAWGLPSAHVASMYTIVDINGDNLPDLHPRGYSLTEPHSFYINTGSGYAADNTNTWEVGQYVPEAHGCGPNNGDNNNFDMNLFLHDINLDGRNDIVYFGGSSDFRVYLNTGSGFTQSTQYSFTAQSGSSYATPSICTNDLDTDNYQSLIDINGDGLVDYYHQQRGIHLNTGAGFAYSTAYTIQIPEMDRAGLSDVNGDGLVDYIALKLYSSNTECVTVYFNNGSGYSIINPAIFPPCSASSTWNPGELRYQNSNRRTHGTLIDLTADGLPDILGSDQYSIWGKLRSINDGRSEWAVNANFNSWQPVTAPGYAKYLDINSDGITDFITPNTTWEGSPMPLSKVYMAKPDVPNRMVRITGALGARSNIEYSTAATDRSDTDISPMPVVKKITVDGIGFGQPSMVTQYAYEFGHYAIDTSTGQSRFAGFGKVTSTESGIDLMPVTVTEGRYHQGNSSDTANGEFQDHISKIGRAYRMETRSGSGSVFSRQVTKWDRHQVYAGRSLVKQAQVVDMEYDGNATHKDRATAYSYNNANGNLIQSTDWGEVTAAQDGTFTDTGTDKRVTDFTYATGGTYGVTAAPSQVTTTNQLSAKIGETRHHYDTLALGQVGKGHETRIESWKSGSSYVSSQTSYNSFGLITQETDGRGKNVNYAYDVHFLYPITVINHLNQQTQYLYSYIFGKPVQVTDPNGRVSTFQFDNRGNLSYEGISNVQNPSQIVTKASHTYTRPGTGEIVAHNKIHSEAIDAPTYEYRDGLGRTVQTRTEAEDAGQFSVIDTSYDALSRKVKESLPYFSSGLVYAMPTITMALYLNYTYDPLGRPLTAVSAAGTATTSYDDWKTTIVDANSKTKRLFNDASGNLVKVEEVNGASTYVTLYEYDGNGNLTKITDALGNVRSFTYDGLGRRLTAQDLHAPADSTFGTWSYAYDDAGNVTSTTDPKSQVVVASYDDLNRRLNEDFQGQAGVETIYSYDSCPDGVGRLCAVITADLVESLEYNAVGEVKKETKTMSSVAYVTQYEFDRQGNQTLITYPDNSQARYNYNAGGMLESVQRKEAADSAFSSLVTDYDYNPAGMVAYQANANGTATTNTFDSAKLYRLLNRTTTIPGGSKAQDLAYTYDNVGNITRIIDNSSTNTKKTVDYTYDDLHRLLSSTATGAVNGQNYSETYSYDAIGNITNKSGIGVYSYSGNTGSNFANPHAVTSAGSLGYTYDNNGNQLVTTTGSGSSTIAADATSTSISNGYTGTTTKTWSHTTSSGSNRLLVLSADLWQDAPGTGSITAASYNGVAMTKATSIRSGGMQSEIWYLANPASGANSVSVTVTGATDSIKLAASTFTGVDQAAPFVATSTSTGTSGNPTVSRTTTVANSMLVATLSRFLNTAATTNRTPLYNNATGSTLGAASYQMATATGSYSDTYTGSAGSAWSMVIAEFRPASGGGVGATVSANTWDYKNRLSRTVVGAKTVTYAYDSSGQRIKYGNGTTASIYPNRYYNTDGTTATKHIFDMNGDVLATVQSTSGSGTGTISPDTTSTSISNGYVRTTTKTWSHVTSSSSNRLMVLSADLWQDVAGTGTVTAASYKGVAMTKATSIRSGGMQSEIWYLANPASGANAVSVTVTGATDSIKLAASTFAGAAQSSVVDASATSTGTSGNPSASVATTAANGLVVATLSRFTNTAATTNRTSLYNNATGSTLGAASYQLATTAGLYSDTYTGSAGSNRSMVIVAFKAAASGGGGATTVTHAHTDHLTGSNAMTSSSGSVVELMDYYPYGGIRLDEKVGAFSEQRKFAGHEHDVDTGLSYMQARYYNGSNGSFISQDPAYLYLDRLMEQLIDPQAWNSYAYARNNPLAYMDPDGQWAIRATISSFLNSVANRITYTPSPFSMVMSPQFEIGKKVFASQIQAVVRDASTVVNPESSNKQVLGATAMLATSALPGGRSSGAIVSNADDAARVAKTAFLWSRTQFSASRQQAAMLRGISNSKVRDYIKSVYQLSDNIIGGTSASVHYTSETGIAIGGSDHIIKNWNNINRGVNLIRKHKLNGVELKRVRELIKRATRANAP